jgi:ABC-type phosphonate transport system ATPase subunit
MYRQIPEMSEEQRFQQYRTEMECVHEIVDLHRQEQTQRACNRLAEHVRQQAEISANAEHAILLVETQAREISELRTALSDEMERSRVLRDLLEAPMTEEEAKLRVEDYERRRKHGEL